MADAGAGERLQKPAAPGLAAGGAPAGHPSRPRPRGASGAGGAVFPPARGPGGHPPALLRGVLHQRDRPAAGLPPGNGALPPVPRPGETAEAVSGIDNKENYHETIQILYGPAGDFPGGPRKAAESGAAKGPLRPLVGEVRGFGRLRRPYHRGGGVEAGPRSRPGPGAVRRSACL